MKKSELLKLTDSELNRLVKIAGTNYDRRRKLTINQVNKIQNSFLKGDDMDDLAFKYDVTTATIKYHVDEDYKNRKNADRILYKMTPAKPGYVEELINYKRSLVSAGKIKA